MYYVEKIARKNRARYTNKSKHLKAVQREDYRLIPVLFVIIKIHMSSCINSYVEIKWNIKNRNCYVYSY